MTIKGHIIAADCLIRLHSIDKTVSALDQGLAVCSAFLDFRKAFDSLDHLILVKHLHQLGVCDIELKWFYNYLNDRLQIVKCDTMNGAVFWVTFHWVARALGPLYF